MATMNPFDLLVDDDTEDLSQLIAKPLAVQQAAKAAPPPAKQTAKLPSKPIPPAQAVRESKSEAPRGGGRSGSRGGGRGQGGGRGINREFADNGNGFGRNNGYSGGPRSSEDGESGTPAERWGYGGPRLGFRGGRRGGLSNGDVADGERPRRGYERRSGTGRGDEIKRDGAGRGNWGMPTDEISPETEVPMEGGKVEDSGKQPGQENAGDYNKETPANESEEKEPEEKEMTLEEYEKVLEEKRRTLLALKPQERKVDLDKEFKSMQLLSNKKNDDGFFVKLGSDKDKRKEITEKAKKSVSINEFLKPADGETYYRPGGRGRGRGRGRGGNNTNIMEFSFSSKKDLEAPAIQDVGQFPSLGGK